MESNSFRVQGMRKVSKKLNWGSENSHQRCYRVFKLRGIETRRAGSKDLDRGGQDLRQRETFAQTSKGSSRILIKKEVRGRGLPKLQK